MHIIGVGSPLLDVLTHVEEDFLAGIAAEKGGMRLVEHHEIDIILGHRPLSPRHAIGGSAANTIVGLARLGAPCSFLGKLGNDHLARHYAESFTAMGVRADRFKYCSQSQTGRCLSLITPDAQRTMRTHLGAALNLHPDEITPADFAGCQHAHLEGYKLFNHQLVYHILECAASAQCTISLDLASFEVVRENRHILDDILTRYIDFVFANEDEAAAFSGSHNPRDGLEALSRFCEVAVVKIGAHGAYIKRGLEVVKVAAERVQAVDTTGAGDLWAAGFLYAYLQGSDLATCGQIGAIIGSSVVQYIGAEIPDQAWEKIKRRVASLMVMRV